VLRLMKGQWAEDLRKLLVTVKSSLAQAGNLGLLLFLLYFICACLGIELFGTLACTTANPCEGMNNKANFEHFFIALLTLFRLSTGDNWNGIMKDALRLPPKVTPCNFAISCQDDCGSGALPCCGGCDDSETCKENCCASTILSPMYFCFFILAAQFVMLNLVVAVLMKELNSAEEADAAEQAAMDKASSKAQQGVGLGEGVQGETTSVEVLRPSQAGDGRNSERRKSFGNTMQDGANYWKRRLSGARQPNNVMYNFPAGAGGKVEDTIVAEGGPVQTGQTLHVTEGNHSAMHRIEDLNSGDRIEDLNSEPKAAVWGQ